MEFFHGTTTAFGLRVGDKLLPAAETGILREEWRKKHTDKVFFTTSLLSARKFAKKASVRFGGEPIVFEVKPKVPYCHINTNEYITDRARIIAVKEYVKNIGLTDPPIKISLQNAGIIFLYGILFGKAHLVMGRTAFSSI